MGFGHFYEADYFYKRGYPFVLTVGGAGIVDSFGEAYIFMLEVPNQTFRLEAAQRINMKQVTQFTAETGIENPDEFVAGRVLDWVENYLRGEQQKDFLQHKEDAVLRPISLVEGGAWMTELARLRFQGLPVEIIDRIGKATSAEGLKNALRSIRQLEPITVRSL